MSRQKGFKHSKETIKKISNSNKGKPSWNKGKKLPPRTKEHSDNISKARKGKVGNKASNWRGGKSIDSEGYIYVYQPFHPLCNNNKNVYEHRLIMEQHLKRHLTPIEEIHHKGIKYPLGSIENKQDNRIENLQLFINKSSHQSFHRKLKQFGKVG